MATLVCSVCSSVLQEIDGNEYVCTGCGRRKKKQPHDSQNIHEVDMDDKTKDMTVILE